MTSAAWCRVGPASAGRCSATVAATISGAAPYFPMLDMEPRDGASSLGMFDPAPPPGMRMPGSRLVRPLAGPVVAAATTTTATPATSVPTSSRLATS